MLRAKRLGIVFALLICAAGCEQKETATPRPPGTTSSATSGSSSNGSSSSSSDVQLPPGHPPIDAGRGASVPVVNSGPKAMDEVDIGGVAMTDNKVMLAGITFALPEGWIRENPGMNAQSPGMSRKAQFRLPKADKGAEDATVAITHFPGMQGMDEANLQRWYGQFSQPDGSPTVSVSSRTEIDAGDVSVTLVDIPGTMGSSRMMGGSGESKTGWRMLAAIVNHEKGPHFVKITGPAEVIERWKPSAVAFFKSVKVNE